MTTEKKVRTPRNADSIISGALKLPLAERVALFKALDKSINDEVKSLQAAADAASKLINKN